VTDRKARRKARLLFCFDVRGNVVLSALSLGQVIAGERPVPPGHTRLEADGLLASRWVEASGGPSRKYYTVTEIGVAFLMEAQLEWDMLVQSMDRLKGENRHD
jgi:hypothetical protein